MGGGVGSKLVQSNGPLVCQLPACSLHIPVPCAVYIASAIIAQQSSDRRNRSAMAA